jgi:hypothetical protein
MSEKPVEAEIQDAVARVLDDENWEVTQEPILGNMRPDFLISDQAGDNNYVVEIKTSPGSLHFGSIAQVAAVQEAAIVDLQKQVRAIVVLAGEEAKELEQAGEDFGVEVLAAESSDPDEIASLVTRYLQSPGQHT